MKRKDGDVMKREELVGVWRLESCDVSDGSEVVLRPFGDAPVGFLVYTNEGTMTAAIMRGGRKHCAANDILMATDAEKVSLVEGYLSYAGTFDIRGDRIVHQVEVSLFPNWVGMSHERIARIDGSVLELFTDPVLLGGRSRVAHMRWRRTQARVGAEAVTQIGGA
jgi:Lipocalin-like domain